MRLSRVEREGIAPQQVVCQRRTLDGRKIGRISKDPRIAHLNLAELCRQKGKNLDTVRKRLAHHPEWTLEQALNYEGYPQRSPQGDRYQRQLGMSLAEFARKVGKPRNTIRHRCERHPDWTPAQIANPPGPLQRPRSQLNGLSIEQCCDQFGVALTTLRKNMRRHPEWDLATLISNSRPTRNRCGAEMPKAKLTDDKAVEIRRLRRGGVRRALVAALFGMHDQTITKITNGQIWGHAVDPQHENIPMDLPETPQCRRCDSTTFSATEDETLIVCDGCGIYYHNPKRKAELAAKTQDMTDNHE